MKVNMANRQRIVTLAAGSFQGKSLIALHVASMLNFSCVLTTDLIRNVLTKQFPRKEYLSTSTYRLSKKDLDNQQHKVSEIIKDIVQIYIDRGEHLIIEGMHFSRDFIEWSVKNNFCSIFLDNKTSFRDRVLYKNITRTKLRICDPGNKPDNYDRLDDSSVMNSSYIKHQERIDEIHQELKKACIEFGFKIIDFSDINIGKKKTVSQIIEFYNCENLESGTPLRY